LEFREPTDAERSIFDRLLGEQFPGQVELYAQLQSLAVRETGGRGSLELRTASSVVARVRHSVPTEGECRDADGMKVHVLLHVIHGKMVELEIFREDLAPLIRPPRGPDLTVFVPYTE
jgi:hypothetical protein